MPSTLKSWIGPAPSPRATRAFHAFPFMKALKWISEIPESTGQWGCHYNGNYSCIPNNYFMNLELFWTRCTPPEASSWTWMTSAELRVVFNNLWISRSSLIIQEALWSLWKSGVYLLPSSVENHYYCCHRTSFQRNQNPPELMGPPTQKFHNDFNRRVLVHKAYKTDFLI